MQAKNEVIPQIKNPHIILLSISMESRVHNKYGPYIYYELLVESMWKIYNCSTIDIFFVLYCYAYNTSQQSVLPCNAVSISLVCNKWGKGGKPMILGWMDCSGVFIGELKVPYTECAW